MANKRKAAAMSKLEDEDPVDPSDELVFIGLGGCQEVGRSCHILQYKGKTVMVQEPKSHSQELPEADYGVARCWYAHRS
jgi:hypothetical protein